MKHARLDLARSAELLPPLEGSIAVFGQINIGRLQGLNFSTLRAVSDSYITNQNLKSVDIQVSRSLSETSTHAIVFVPRAKSEAWHLISAALRAAPGGWIVIDGQKTDGIESITKQINNDVESVASYSKGHGKALWFRAKSAFKLLDYDAGPATNKDGFLTAPGVFSADGIDSASACLIDALPHQLSGDVADLGAGWGFLASQVLKKNSKIRSMHMVEDNAAALDCARENTVDPRAVFHWADALQWKNTTLLDAVVMNPPFHVGRSAEPSLGMDFIRTAARLLKPDGVLYMVANAHLPYESILEQCFQSFSLLSRTNRFKVFSAKRGRGR